MKHGAEPALDHPLALAAAAPRPILVLPVVEDAAERDVRDQLIRCLAADRLRDLRDDGVTVAYVARMYGVDPELMERLSNDLLPLRTR